MLDVCVAVLVVAKLETVSRKVTVVWVCWICGAQIGTGIVFSLSTSTFPFQHYSSSAPYSYFIYLSPAPYIASVMDVTSSERQYTERKKWKCPAVRPGLRTGYPDCCF